MTDKLSRRERVALLVVTFYWVFILFGAVLIDYVFGTGYIIGAAFAIVGTMVISLAGLLVSTWL